MGLVNEYLMSRDRRKVFAYSFRGAIDALQDQEKSVMRSSEKIVDSFYEFDYVPNTFDKRKVLCGWKVYDPEVEFRRQGCRVLDDVVDSPTINSWRFFHNVDYSFCASYPEYFLVPSCMSDAEVKKCFEFRSRSRIPTVTWKHPSNHCVILRSSQPHSGFSRATSPHDEKLVNTIRKISNCKTMFICDLRSKTYAMGNILMGKGYEVITGYERGKLEFFGIDNIHGMSKSFEALQEVIYNTSENGNWLRGLNTSGWLGHTKLILESARKVSERVEKGHGSCLVHCSDGWDRTPQVCCIAQILLDPYYRTLEGFMVLLEKDWMDFGHQFKERCGVMDSGSDHVSPIFIQFVDVVRCLLGQFKDRFEYNDHFLITLLHHCYSGMFGNFIFDNNLERAKNKMKQETVSLWTYVNVKKESFKNAMYNPSNDVRNRVLVPKTDEKTVTSNFWETFYFRFIPGRISSEYIQTKEYLEKMAKRVQTLEAQLKKEKKMTKGLREDNDRLKKLVEKQQRVIEKKEFSQFFDAKKDCKVIKSYFGEGKKEDDDEVFDVLF